MIARYGIAIAIGAGVTFGLLFIMQLLIATGRGAIVDGAGFRVVDFVRVEREQTIETKQDKPDKPPEPDQQPDIPQADTSGDFDNSLRVSMSTPTLTTNLNVGNLGFGVADGEYLPIVKVAPIYPARAASRGLEGYVIVEYTVTRTGATRDARVVESSSSLFERAAVDSALKYKYRPRVIDGEPVEVPGVRTIIRFELEN
ncbi:energy transducer TonB [Candidatus Rariloculus sp.]|uniref:energy transducer TonB n=1 Tax=Candidatus Rariloculus sp. TaxID=3101265 RepID=UPI003D13F918